MDPAKPLIVQSDRTLLLDVHSPEAEDARSAILPFAELEKSPEHIQTYRITPLSLWNAASAGFQPRDIIAVLERYSRYPVPAGIVDGFSDTMARYGKIRMTGTAKEVSDTLRLLVEDRAILAEIEDTGSLTKYLVPAGGGFRLKVTDRGTVKRELIRLGWPVKDEAAFAKGEALDIRLRKTSVSGLPFTLRDYQIEAARSVA